MISDFAIEQIRVPEYHVDKYNNTSMLNYWCVVEPLLSIFQPSSICEIGSDEAITTLHIRKYLVDREIIFNVVDPAALSMLDEYISDKFRIHRETSVEYLTKEIGNDFYFLDGDHNYETVTRELELIHKASKGKNTATCILVHDIGWPCARRDSYYSVGDVAAPLKHNFNSGLSLEDELLNNGRSFPCGQTFAWAEFDPEDKSGVLTAVEDFLESNTNWSYFSFSSFYGCGVLYSRDNLSVENLQHIKKIQDNLEFINPLLAISEANRLRLIQGLHEHQYDLREIRLEFSDLKNDFGRLYQTAEERLKHIKVLQSERDDLFNVAESRLGDINDLKDRFDNLYLVAEQRLAEINDLRSRFEDLYQVAEQRLSNINELNQVLSSVENNFDEFKANHTHTNESFDELYGTAEARLAEIVQLVELCDDLKLQIRIVKEELKLKDRFLNISIIKLFYKLFLRFKKATDM